MIKLTIPLPPVTKKNSSQIFRRANGSPFVTTSKKYKEYVDNLIFIGQKPAEAINEPVNIKAIYYMPNNRLTDITNLHSCLHDILKTYGIIADDNYHIAAATDGSRVRVDRNAPRTEIEIEYLDDEPAYNPKKSKKRGNGYA